MNGSDRNSGTEASPFATVMRAHDACNAGDGIYVKAGHYVSGELTWKKSNLILRGAPGTTREDVILERSGSGSGQLLRFHCDRINGDTPLENIHVYGLTLQGGAELADPWSNENREAWRREVVTITGYMRDLKIINCVVRHAQNRGIFNAGSISSEGRANGDFPHNLEYAYNNIYHTGGVTRNAGADISLGADVGFVHVHHSELHGEVDGIVTANQFVGSLFEYNHVFDHLGWNKQGDRDGDSEDGIDIKRCYKSNPLLPGSAGDPGHRTIVRNNVIHGHPYQFGINIQFGTQHVDIYGNKVYDNGTGMFIRRGSDSQVRPRNTGWTGHINITDNDFHDNLRNAISTLDADGANHVLIDGNRFYDNGETSSPQIIAGLNLRGGKDFTITNNIISNNGQSQSGKPQYYIAISLSEIRSNNNTFYLPDTSFNVARIGSNSPTTLSGWQSASGQDGDSSQVSGRYEKTLPPQPPSRMEVTGAQSPGDTERVLTGAKQKGNAGLLG